MMSQSSGHQPILIYGLEINGITFLILWLCSCCEL